MVMTLESPPPNTVALTDLMQMGSRTAKAFQTIDERGFCELYLSEVSNVS